MVVSSASRKKATGRILLVDDNRSGLAARRMLLEELGYQTAVTQSPKEAFGLFVKAKQAKEAFDLVITDYKMPEMNGVELIAKMREESPDIPVILLSGFVDALGLTEKTTGANVVIMKSAHEVQTLIRSANRLVTLGARRKPPAKATVAAKSKRKTSTGD
jgi:CheY-like chemotaxis protein